MLVRAHAGGMRWGPERFTYLRFAGEDMRRDREVRVRVRVRVSDRVKVRWDT